MTRYTRPFTFEGKKMFKVFIDGNDDRLRLEDATGRRIGWIRGHAIGFAGLLNQGIAIRGVLKAWPALEESLQRAYPRRTRRPINASNVRVVHDGAYEWVADGSFPLARLVPSGVGDDSDESLALEFIIPSYATQHVTIATAQAVWAALSGLIAVTHVAEEFATSSALEPDELLEAVASGAR
jgi:hypothetical protein